MFELIDSTGLPVRMRSGEPFRYSTASFARIGKYLLEAVAAKRERPVFLRVREVVR